MRRSKDKKSFFDEHLELCASESLKLIVQLFNCATMAYVRIDASVRYKIERSHGQSASFIDSFVERIVIEKY